MGTIRKDDQYNLAQIMTAQITDTFIYNGERYELFKLDGEKLIAPQDYGMNPEAWTSACWKGFYSTYKITNDGLFLTKMTMGEVKEGYKLIGGIKPEVYDPDSDYNFDGNAIYRDLKVLVSFTGKIKLSKDYYFGIEWDIYDYDKKFDIDVIEFTFEAGKLVSIQDLGIITLSKD